ncbi:hypothetical protein [Mycoplasmopsis pulmonis]|nr:hypothetical protein [Mycoplasmopsis pulmonis]MDZ7293441.1 hypothetical protein [Mycoplasmopsis pulmonis]
MFKTQIDNYTIKKPKSFFTKIIFEFNSIKYTLFSLFLILFIQTIVIVVEKPEQNNQEQINWFDHIWTSWLKSFSNENNLDLIYYPNSLNAGLIFTLISATLFKFLHWGWILVILFTYLLITFLIVFRKAIAKKIKAPKAPSNNAEKISQKENKKYLKMLKKSKIQNISFENPQEYELSSNFQDDSKIEDIENSDSKNDFLNYNSINSSENKIEEKSDPFDIGDTNIFTIETNDENNSKKDDPEEDIWSLEDENFLNNEREK